MVTVLALLGVLAVLFAAAVLSTREEGLLADDSPPDEHLPLPDEPMTPEDVGRLRFSLAARGYRMSQVDDALARLVGELADRDRRIALLEAAAEGHEQATPVREATVEDLPQEAELPEPVVAPVVAPVIAAPVAAAPVESMPAEPAPAEPMPAEPVPVEPVPVEPVPVEPVPVEPEPEPEPAPADPAPPLPAAPPTPPLADEPATEPPAPTTPSYEPASVPPPAGPPAPDAPGEPRLGDQATASTAPAAAGPITWSSPGAVPEFPVISAPESADPLPPADLPTELVTEERTEQPHVDEPDPQR